jgi:hypothetical protein
MVSDSDAMHAPPPDERGARASGSRWPMILLRYALPGAVILAGLIVMALGGETNLEGGGGIVSAGLAILFVNLLFRAGTAGERERDAEEEAREYFDRHGHWPD